VHHDCRNQEYESKYVKQVVGGIFVMLPLVPYKYGTKQVILLQH
jgi:hypothetical protein